MTDAGKTCFVRLMKSCELEKAARPSEQALSWNYEEAKDWKYDLCFVKYLTVIETNSPIGFDQR